MPPIQHAPLEEFTAVLQSSADPVGVTRAFAAQARLNTLYMIMRAGSGHIGSSFSSLDIVSWLFLQELRHPADASSPRDTYFSSKGHDVPGLYATLLGTSRLPFELIHGLRRLDGLPGHPDVATPFMETNTGPLGMGISKAKGMVIAQRLQGRAGRFYVLTGDGELQEGQFWESLQSAVNHRMGELTVIVDHNKIQSDTWVRDVSDLGDLERKIAAFGWEVARCDGHDLPALAAQLDAWKAVTDRPKLLIADTVKGRGVSFMEGSAMSPQDRFYRFHSGAPDDDTYARAVAELRAAINEARAAIGVGPVTLVSSERPPRVNFAGAQRMVAAYGRALVAEAERATDIVALDADLVLDTGLIPFSEQFPERFIECGIAEMDMVSMAGGLALRGMRPVVHSFSCFLSTRPNEQIYNNVTERTRIVYVGSLAGLLPSGPGHSHQSVRDISAIGGMPGLDVVEPCCEAEVASALSYGLHDAPGSTWLRLVSIPCQVPYVLPADAAFRRGHGTVLREGEGIALIGYGPVLLPQAYLAAEQFEARTGVRTRVINLPWLNLVDDAWLTAALTGIRAVVTLDNHYVRFGQGEMVAAAMARLGVTATVRHLGLRDVPACGQNDEVLAAHGLDAAAIGAALEESVA